MEPVHKFSAGLEPDTLLGNVAVKKRPHHFGLVVRGKGILRHQATEEVVLAKEVAVHGKDHLVRRRVSGLDFYGLRVDLFRDFPLGVSNIPDRRNRLQVLKRPDQLHIKDLGDPSQGLVYVDPLGVGYGYARARLSPVLAGARRQEGLVDQLAVTGSVYPYNAVHVVSSFSGYVGMILLKGAYRSLAQAEPGDSAGGGKSGGQGGDVGDTVADGRLADV